MAGNIQKNGQSKARLLRILEQAVEGIIEIQGKQYSLHAEQRLDFFSEMVRRDRWFSNLHLEVIGSRITTPLNVDFITIDSQLRTNDLPFDGLPDLISWLGLREPHPSEVTPSINIYVNPPVDIVIDACKLQNDDFSLVLHAHPRFDVARMHLAVRAAPGKALSGRKQVAQDILWNTESKERLEGFARVSLEHADSALAMLQIGETTVRRQWFLDPVKSRNSRLMASQLFDKDLRMIRLAVLESQDAGRFEKGIAALLFILGFSPATQVETDSPDLIVTTPGGKVILIECTLRVADFGQKVGKLVDRCRALSKVFKSSEHYAPVYGALVCSLPKDQIASHFGVLEDNRIFLVTKDDLHSAFNRIQFPSDPDELISSAEKKFSQKDMFSVA